MSYSWILKPRFLIFVPLVLILLIALACGEDATSTPRPTPVPAATVTPQPTEAPTPTAPAVMDELEPVYGGVLTRASVSTIAGWDIMAHFSSVTTWNIAQYYSNLLEYDPLNPGELICGVCTEYTLSPDGLSYTFKIRKDVEFHNGTQLTAEDVKFSLDRMLEKDKPRPSVGRLKNYVDRVEIDDPYTVTVYFMQPAPIFPGLIGMSSFKMYSKEWVGGGKDPNNHPNVMGSGPWLAVEYTEGVGQKAERNPNYFRKGLPYMDGIETFILRDPGTELAAYKTEKVIFSEHTRQGIDSLSKLARDNEFLSKFDIWWEPGVNGIGLLLNTKRTPFDNPIVREAINLAVHRQILNQTLGLGRWSIGKPMSPNNPHSLSDEEILQRPGFRELNGKKHPDDIARAKELWAEAGFGPNNRMKALISVTESKPHPELGQAIKQMLEEVLEYVDLEFRVQEGSVNIGNRRSGNFDMNTGGGGGFPDPDTRFAAKYLPGSGEYSGHTFVGLKELWLAQSREVDFEKRQKIAFEMQRLVLDQAPAQLELVWETQAILVHKRIMTKAGRFVHQFHRANADEHYHDWLLTETPDRPAFGADAGFGGN